MKEGFVRHSKNAAGPFYVVDGECMACGAPELAAGGLMSHDGALGQQCFFVRQPKTAAEVDHAIRAVWSSCCGALRYGGDDAAVINKLAVLGSYECCDEKIDFQPSQVIRTCVQFDYQDSNPDASLRPRLNRLMRVLKDRLTGPGRWSSKFWCWRTKGSFQMNWGSPEMKLKVRFEVEHLIDERWSVRVHHDDGPPVGWILGLYDGIRVDAAFQNVEWFNRDEGAMIGEGSAAPY